jgi:hypothetical protein
LAAKGIDRGCSRAGCDEAFATLQNLNFSPEGSAKRWPTGFAAPRSGTGVWADSVATLACTDYSRSETFHNTMFRGEGIHRKPPSARPWHSGTGLCVLAARNHPGNAMGRTCLHCWRSATDIAGRRHPGYPIHPGTSHPVLCWCGRLTREVLSPAIVGGCGRALLCLRNVQEPSHPPIPCLPAGRF